MPRQGLMLIILAAAITLAGPVTAKAEPLKTIVILPFDLQDDQQELSPAKLEYQRLVNIRNQLQQEFSQKQIYQVIDSAPAVKLIEHYKATQDLHNCNGCEVEIAHSVQAQRVLVAWVQKVSNLILNFNIQIEDVSTGEVLLKRSVDMRGNTDQSWQRSVSYLVKQMVDSNEVNR